MLLADLGATVLRLERHDYVQLGTDKPARFNLLTRNRQTLKLNLKEPEGIETALRIIDRSDALIEGFRPGVMERLGLSPEKCLARNFQARLCASHRLGQDDLWRRRRGTTSTMSPCQAPYTRSAVRTLPLPRPWRC